MEQRDKNVIDFINLVEVAIFDGHALASAPILNGVTVASFVIAPRCIKAELDRTSDKFKGTIIHLHIFAPHGTNGKTSYIGKMKIGKGHVFGVSTIEYFNRLGKFD